MADDASGVAPVAPRERHASLDVLRGFALFGVFLVNFVWFAADLMTTEAQAEAMPTARIDAVLQWLVGWLAGDKANTLFAFLFGVGFSIQMQRLSERGGGFERIYLRRLAILFVMGLVHVVFFWEWDILHLYALVGFVLFACRNVSDRVLLWIGLPLTFFARPAIDLANRAFGRYDLPGSEAFLEEPGILRRQELSEIGDYMGLVDHFARFLWYDWLASGLIVAWVFYVLGRFFLGHWVGRRDFLTRPERHLPLLRKALWMSLPVGLVLSAVGMSIEGEDPLPGLEAFPLIDGYTIGGFIHVLGTPFIVCAYVCAILLGLQGGASKRVLELLSPVGRMALTNYLTQSIFYAFFLFGIGPGLNLGGRIGTLPVVVIAIAGFALQIAFSHWWLARFRFGPAEWLWRALTYGTWPSMRIGTAT